MILQRENKFATCVKGKFSWGHINSDQRLTKPLVRKNGEFHEVEWDEALNVIADNFTSIKEKYGPDALSFISSSKATNEESYLMQKLARQVIGTDNSSITVQDIAERLQPKDYLERLDTAVTQVVLKI